jgi:hypothetical protein
VGAVDAPTGDAGPPAPTVIDSEYVADDDPDLLNPARGIYYWSPRDDDPHTLVAEWLYLGDACDRDLTWAGLGDPATSPVLEAYARALALHRDTGQKVIFRPRYDTASSGGVLNRCGVFQADTEPRMRGHVVAIAEMLAASADVIAFVEGGYLGRWGEWNHADHAPSTAPVLVDPDARRGFLRHVLDTYAAAGLERFVELRRPVFAREQLDADPSARVGLYNDCFMTTSSDFGTYSNFESGNPSNFASAEEAKAWAIELTAVAPFGGETCPTGDMMERWRSCDAMVGPSSEPAALHMSYLHGGYAVEARPRWEAEGCYDEIRRRLGYRFEVRSVSYAPSASEGQPVEVRVQIANTGWSRMHDLRRAFVVLRGAARAYAVGVALGGYEARSGAVEGDTVASWAPGEESELVARFAAPPPGAYEVTLLLPDPDRPEVTRYAVALASRRDGAPLFDSASGENALGVVLSVE